MVYTAKRKFAKKPTRRPSYKKKRVARPSIKKIVQAAINKNLETKTTVYSSPDGVQIFHNNFITMDSTVLATEQGVMSNDSGSWSRVGDEIMLKGVSLKFMLEVNERFTDVTFRILVVRCAKGDVPTRATLFNGLSGNKMIDTLNRERYTVIAQKYWSRKGDLTMISGPGLPGEGNNTNSQIASSRATKIIKMWIPGAKFGRGGKIQYENGSTQVKFFDYHVLCYAYSNYSTLQDEFYVGRVNDYVKQIYFKDG